MALSGGGEPVAPCSPGSLRSAKRFALGMLPMAHFGSSEAELWNDNWTKWGVASSLQLKDWGWVDPEPTSGIAHSPGAMVEAACFHANQGRGNTVRWGFQIPLFFRGGVKIGHRTVVTF